MANKWSRRCYSCAKHLTEGLVFGAGLLSERFFCNSTCLHQSIKNTQDLHTWETQGVVDGKAL